MSSTEWWVGLNSAAGKYSVQLWLDNSGSFPACLQDLWLCTQAFSFPARWQRVWINAGVFVIVQGICFITLRLLKMKPETTAQEGSAHQDKIIEHLYFWGGPSKYRWLSWSAYTCVCVQRLVCLHVCWCWWRCCFYNCICLRGVHSCLCVFFFFFFSPPATSCLNAKVCIHSSGVRSSFARGSDAAILLREGCDSWVILCWRIAAGVLSPCRSSFICCAKAAKRTKIGLMLPQFGDAKKVREWWTSKDWTKRNDEGGN